MTLSLDTPTVNKAQWRLNARLIAGTWALLGIGLLALVWPTAAVVFIGWLLLLALGVALDIITLTPCEFRPQHLITRSHPTQGQGFELVLTYALVGSWQRCRYRLTAIENDIFVPPDNEWSPALMADTTTTLIDATWTLIPKKRGCWPWTGVIIRVNGPMRLLERYQTLSDSVIEVYPNLFTHHQTPLNPPMLMNLLGLKITRQRRSDVEFESLRPYAYGDNYRHIDWKASARLGQLISRQFHIEQHHTVVVCLDLSRTMSTLSDGLSKLDWAIETCLQLAYLAQQYQDQLGLLLFANNTIRWIKPQKHVLPQLLEALMDISAQRVEANYQDACLSLLTHQKKRALVLFLTDFMDVESIKPALPSFQRLNERHYTLFIGIDDPVYHAYLNQLPAPTELGVTETMVALSSMQRRELALKELKRIGLDTINCRPDNLVSEAMKSYLSIREMGKL